MSDSIPISEDSKQPEARKCLSSLTAFMHLGSGYCISRIGWHGEKYLCGVPSPDINSNAEVKMFDKVGAQMDWSETEMEIDLGMEDWIVINIPKT